jgi:hypothetical protein
VTRRTLRTNLRFLARKVVPQLCPADLPLPREQAKAPYSPAEIDAYLALADAQLTAARQMRAAGLVCLGAGAGLIRADLRQARGTDIICRPGGVVAVVRGARPRAVQTITVPPGVAAKTRQKHDYPSPQHPWPAASTSCFAYKITSLGRRHARMRSGPASAATATWCPSTPAARTAASTGESRV